MLRNKEIRRSVILVLFITMITVVLGFTINKAAGFLAVFSSMAFGIVFFTFTRIRYRKIAEMSEQIDMVLHHAERLFIEEADEGELSILQSEIAKMTLRIREQNDALKKEKTHLADSLADIAHQLRTPLTSMNLILPLLEKQPDARERQKQIYEVKELLIHMDWLLTSLLKLSRVDACIVTFQSEPVEVNQLVSAALRPFLIPMELHEIELIVDVPKQIQIKGDLGWLSEAIQNIIKNCMESVGDNGTIAVTCTDNTLFTEITIHDSGDGFKKEDLPFLFERFYRGTGQNATGYGIGLALTRMIITRQGGSITAKNHPQGGAAFTIRFPK